MSVLSNCKVEDEDTLCYTKIIVGRRLGTDLLAREGVSNPFSEETRVVGALNSQSRRPGSKSLLCAL